MNTENFPVPPEKAIIFDTETTGLDPFDRDEILQLSIIDGNGKVLFSDYIKPAHRRKWDDAMRIHGITPDMVRGKRKFDEIKDEVKEIFNRAELVVGYNLSFDLGFLKAEGIKPNPDALVFDVMHEFAPVHGKWNAYHGDYTWAKLSVCAKHYGFKFQAHDALEDTRATLHCYKAMLADDEEYGYLDYLETVKNGGPEAWRDKLKKKGRPEHWFDGYVPGRSAFQDEIESLYQSGASNVEINRKINEIEAYSDPIYDEIDEDIYKCFIDGASFCHAESLTHSELELPDSRQDKLYTDRKSNMLAAIAEVCEQKDGRLYKSKAKAVKWVIVGSAYNWHISRVENLRNKGYKVTNLPAAIRFFGLEEYWNCDNQIAFYEDHKKWNQKRIEDEKAGIDPCRFEYTIDLSDLKRESEEERRTIQTAQPPAIQTKPTQQPVAQPVPTQQPIKQKNSPAGIAFKILAIVMMILLGLPMLAVEPIFGIVITVVAVMAWRFGNRYKR